MKKNLIFIFALFFTCFNFHNLSAQEKASELEQKQEQEPKEEVILLNRSDKLYREKLAKIQAERAKETNRFKKKAIENTEAREKKKQEIIQKQIDKSSRFQKEAQVKTEEKKQAEIQKDITPSESRFTEMAKIKAEQRALKKELKEKKLHRNKE